MAADQANSYQAELTNNLVDENRCTTSTSVAVHTVTNETQSNILDPISESYKSLVMLINRTSAEFKKGNKWKCNDLCRGEQFNLDNPRHYSKSWKDLDQIAATQDVITNDSRASGVKSESMTGKSRSQLVRQMATDSDHGSKETLDEVSDIPSQRKYIHSQGRMLLRQWTTDGYPPSSLNEVISNTPKRPGHPGAAFLLRPVSSHGQQGSKDHSNIIPLDRPPSPAKLAAIDAAVAAAGGGYQKRGPRSINYQSRAAMFSTTRTHSAGEVNQVPDFSCSSSYVRRLHKQPTIESAPTPREGGQSRTESSLPRQHSIYSAGGYSSRDFTDQLFDHHQVRSNSPSYQGSSRSALRANRLLKQPTTESVPTPREGGLNYRDPRLLRQHSANSTGLYSTGGISDQHQYLHTTYSHQGITLIRGTSCSLVDIPTYLGPQNRRVDLGHISSSPIGTIVAQTGALQPPEPRPRPRLQLDLTQRKHVKSSTKKTKWTILCVGLTLLMMSVTIVGTMLSVGSQYQQMVIAKQWEILIQNKTYGTSTTSATLGPNLQTSWETINREFLSKDSDTTKNQTIDGVNSNQTQVADVQHLNSNDSSTSDNLMRVKTKTQESDNDSPQ